MIDWVERLINSPIARRYRKWLATAALLLGLLQFVAFVLSLLFAGQAWVANLMQYARDLMTLTLALVLVVLATYALESMYSTDLARREEIHEFVEKSLKPWAVPHLATEPQKSAGHSNKSDHRFTHFKAYWNSAATTDPCLKAFQEDVHFELTVYPTKLIYGLHFELNHPAINQALMETACQLLDLSKMSGFELDQQIPKKPGWRFYIRTIPLESDSKKDTPAILTHARHFVELVGHGHAILYGDQMVKQYLQAIEQHAKPQSVPAPSPLAQVLASVPDRKGPFPAGPKVDV